MPRLSLISLALMIFAGCTGPAFANMGNGVGVPSASIDKYAAENGLTRDQARTQMRQDADQQRILEHAERYGITPEEGESQLDHARQ